MSQNCQAHFSIVIHQASRWNNTGKEGHNFELIKMNCSVYQMKNY